MPDEPRLIVERDPEVTTLILNRPHVRNAIDDALQEDLIAALTEIRSDTASPVVVITGRGTAFCSGGDVSGMNQRLRASATDVAMNGLRRLQRTQRMITAMYDLEKVTIAAINGAAVGVGLDLALSCDFLVAARGAVFSMGYVKVGLVPDGGGLYHLPRRIGIAAAKDLVFSGRTVDAAEALDLGLVDEVVEPDDLRMATRSFAERFVGMPGTSITLAKSILNRADGASLDAMLDRSARAQAICYTTRQHRDAVAAFFEPSDDEDGSGEGRSS